MSKCDRGWKEKSVGVVLVAAIARPDADRLERDVHVLEVPERLAGYRWTVRDSRR